MKILKTISILCLAATVFAAPSLYSAVNIGTVNTDVTVNNTDFTRTPSSANLTAAPSGTQSGGSYTFTYGGFSGVATVASGSTATPNFSLTITNTTGTTLTSITLSGLVAQLKGNSGSLTETLTASVTGISGFTVSSTTAGGVAANSLNINTIAGSGVPSTPVTGVYNATISGFSLASGSSFTITWADMNDGGTDAMFGLANVKVRANVVATNNNTAITAPATASVGRVMQGSATTTNVTLNKAGSDATSFSATPDAGAIVGATSGSIAAGSSTSTASVGVNTSTTGAKTGTVTIDNLATSNNGAGTGSLDPNDTITVSGTVVANRDVDASSVDLGKVFVDAAVSGTTTVTTTGDDEHFTRVTVNGSQVVNGGITATAGSSATFDDAADTATRIVTGNFASSGAQSGSVNLSVTGEGLAGESVGPVTVNVTADVYERARLITNNDNALASGDGVSIVNDFADGTQRAAAQIASKTVNGSGWSANGVDVGSVLPENGEATGDVSFDDTGKLNGTHIGSLVIGFQYADSTIKGAGAATELAARTWTMSHTVSGRTASSGNATVLAGGSYEGFSLKNSSGRATDVAILAGTASDTTTISMDFSTIDPGASNDAFRVSDIVDLEGTDGDMIVLQLTYDEGDLGALLEGDLRLAWFNGTDWVEATFGNIGLGTGGFVGDTAYDSGFFVLGNYGIDTATNTVWAVVNHNSEFAVVGSPIPEPGTIALLALTGGYFMISRRRKRA